HANLTVTLTLPNPPTPPPIHTLSLHDALPISSPAQQPPPDRADERPALLAAGNPGRLLRRRDRHGRQHPPRRPPRRTDPDAVERSEEHTSELQSLRHLVCRLLLEKKKKPRQAPTSLTPTTCTSSRRHTCR